MHDRQQRRNLTNSFKPATERDSTSERRPTMEALVRSHRKPQNSTLNGTYRLCFPGASEDEHCQHYRSCVTEPHDSPLRVDRVTATNATPFHWVRCDVRHRQEGSLRDCPPKRLACGLRLNQKPAEHTTHKHSSPHLATFITMHILQYK